VGPGFRVCLLGRAGVHYLVQRAKYGCCCCCLGPRRSSRSHEPWCRPVRSSQARQLPRLPEEGAGEADDSFLSDEKSSLDGDEELPVSWVATNFEGAVGRLMTDEGYRRHGLGSLITTVAARRQATLLKLIPHAFVDASNAASLAMFTGLHGWKVTHDGVFWLLAGVTLQTYNQRQ
ncbi:uncharacterized protein LOC126990197, partial [Eriocheir sinensis]|uniref:uncharacterized protein LOC126990197 n=1 Tax=Eriocheir sinensis TaxID=95602 RepID=UPI0021C90134